MITIRWAARASALLALPLALAGTPAFAQAPRAKVLGKACHETTLKVNIYNGQIIRTNDGYVFQIGPYDQFDTQFWLTDDELTICATKVRVGGHVVTRYRLSDYFSAGDNPAGEKATLMSGPKGK